MRFNAFISLAKLFVPVDQTSASLPLPKAGQQCMWAATVSTLLLIGVFTYQTEFTDIRSVFVFRAVCAIAASGLLFLTGLKCGVRTSLGMAWASSSRFVLPVGLLFLAFVPIIAYASLLPDFQEYYPIDARARESLSSLLTSWGFSFLDCLAWEIFFRGALVIGLSRFVGSLALPMSIPPYVLSHLGKPLPEVIGSFVAGIFLGNLALRSGSIWLGTLLHSLCGFALDAAVLVSVHYF